ncbi:ABC transporter permease [Stenotrophomonas sp. HMSC10F06]|uniref:ABC transporter permease n=1 Tax=Gammaproteobacteria TaxID=1236 RepID=UPI0008A1023E|nr:MULTISPECIES: ABC transporter permease [Gammaproteobacteria]OFS94434.1 ABC transporter permease [Stenotrophomonas sp. HMSC10F06]
MSASNLAGLIFQLTRREVSGRYKGSVLGLFWSFVNPLLMLSVYTLFFSVILKVRWGDEPQRQSDFAILLFVGLILHGFIAECINRAPGLITGNVNYVKKVVFPIGILPVVSCASALFHWFISLTVLALALLFVGTGIPATFPLILVVMVPLILYALGISWMLASVGVYLRDVSQVVGVLSQILLFMSPVFFPVTKIPEYIRPVFLANPLTTIIEQARAVAVFGQLPDWWQLAGQTAIATTVCVLGLIWFRRTKCGFADVL